MSKVCIVALQNSRTMRELASLGADFASINISNSHVTHSKVGREYQKSNNFADPIQARRAYEALMHEVNREVRCIGTKYSVKMEHMYFVCGKYIPTLEKHFPDIFKRDIEL